MDEQTVLGRSSMKDVRGKEFRSEFRFDHLKDELLERFEVKGEPLFSGIAEFSGTKPEQRYGVDNRVLVFKQGLVFVPDFGRYFKRRLRVLECEDMAYVIDSLLWLNPGASGTTRKYMANFIGRYFVVVSKGVASISHEDILQEIEYRDLAGVVKFFVPTKGKAVLYGSTCNLSTADKIGISKRALANVVSVGKGVAIHGLVELLGDVNQVQKVTVSRVSQASGELSTKVINKHMLGRTITRVGVLNSQPARRFLSDETVSKYMESEVLFLSGDSNNIVAKKLGSHKATVAKFRKVFNDRVLDYGVREA